MNAPKNTKIANAFGLKKPPPPLYNVLRFLPPLSSLMAAAEAKKRRHSSTKSLKAGRETIHLLKQLLGAARYKKLRSVMRDLASRTITPKCYVDEVALLFDNGLGDGAFWDNVPPLIPNVPNAAAANAAMYYLESV